MINLAKAIKEVAYLEGDFTTRSGKKTSYYIDKYRFETKPDILKEIAAQIAQKLPDSKKYDYLAAPELGGVAIAAAVSIAVNKPFLIVRKKSKGYGTANLIEGPYTKNQTAIMLEDVITTGGAVLTACDILKENKIHVTHIITVIDREEGASETIESNGYTIDRLLTTSDLKNA